MNTPAHHTASLSAPVETLRKIFLASLTASAIIGPGLGYGKIYVFHVVLACASVFSAYYLYRQKRWDKLKVMLVPFLLFSFMGISLLWAPSFALGAKQILITGMGMGLIINLVALSETRSDLYLILKTVAVLFVLSCTIGIFESLTGISWPWSRNSPWLNKLGREVFLTRKRFSREEVELIRHTPTAFFWNPNNLAVFVTCFLPFILFSKLNRWLVLGATLLALAVIMAAGARMCFWVLMGMAPLWLIFARKKVQWVSASVLTVLLFFISLNAYVWMLPVPMFDQFSPPYAEKVFNRPIAGHKKGTKGHKPAKPPVAEEENSLSFRREMNKRAIKLLKQKPLFGQGPGGVEHEFTVRKNKSKLVDLHFYWLELLVNYGIFWFLGLVAALVYVTRKLWKKNTRPARNLVFSLVLFSLCVISLSTAFYYLTGYLLFGCLLICSSIPPPSHETVDLR